MLQKIQAHSLNILTAELDAKKEGMPKATDKQIAEIHESQMDILVDLYRKPSDEQYVATGHFMTPVMQTDFELCQQFGPNN